MTIITCVEDFKQLHKQRVPKMFFDYCESGSFTESTFRRNEADMQDILIRQRVGKDISEIDATTIIAGEKARIPAVIAPVGLLGAQHPAGEIKAALAARDFGIPFTLSTMSICSIEQVAEATGAPFWFQLYVVRDRGFVRDLIHRAKAANCSQLVVTMDLTILGQRHKDIKNKMSIKPSFKNLLNIATKPRWALGMLQTPYKTFGNIVGHAKGADDLSSLMTWAAESVDPRLNWDDLEWIKKEWDGPIIVKGIMDVEDAKIASDLGVETMVVSNHGGRQLDGAGSTISLLPEIADAIGDKAELINDSGIRTGIDIFRSCALGASGVMLGRAMVYALGAMGQDGVHKMLEIVEKELKTTMGLAGALDTSAITKDCVYKAQ